LEGAVLCVVPAAVAVLPQHIAGNEPREKGDGDENAEVAGEFVRVHAWSQVVMWVGYKKS
jgi:hypothetical protein